MPNLFLRSLTITFLTALVLASAATASADWFTMLMTIENGRDTAFEQHWRAETACAECTHRHCKKHHATNDTQSPAPPLIAPRSRFFPLPTRPVFEPQVPWVAREVALDASPYALEPVELTPIQPAPRQQPYNGPLRLQIAPEAIEPIKPEPLPEPADHQPLSFESSTDGWKPARPRK